MRTLQELKAGGGQCPPYNNPTTIRPHEQSCGDQNTRILKWCAVTTLHKHNSCGGRNGGQLKGWCAVRTLHKPYLCIPQIARLVGGAHPTTIRPPRARIHEQSCAVTTLHKHNLRGRNFKRLVRGAHPTRTKGLRGSAPYIELKAGAPCAPYKN